LHVSSKKITQKNRPENKKPAGAFCFSGPVKSLFSYLLDTSQRTRYMAMMMLCPVIVETCHLEISGYRNRATLSTEIATRNARKPELNC